MELYGQATLGCSKVARVLKVIFGKNLKKAPCATTIRNWVFRTGLHILERPIEKSEDLVAIGDITISLGKIKCLAILGSRMDKLKERGDYTLNHQDVEILGIHLTEKATGDFVEQSFEETRKHVGINFLGIVIDQGPEMKKGCRQYQKNYGGVVVHDIKHKMSLVIEHALKKNPVWIEYNKKILETRRLIQQTAFAAMIPPRQRHKARYMDIGYILAWQKRVKEAKKNGGLDSMSNEKYEEYFGWFKEYEKSFENWNFMEGAVNLINSTCRKHGLSNETYEYLKLIFNEAILISDKYLKKFLKTALKAVEEEKNKLKRKQVILCSTEVVESIFGKYKELNCGNQGIGSNILGLATFVGPKLTEESIKKALECCSVKKMLNWTKEKILDTIGSLRHRFFKVVKRTKFDKIFKECVAA